MPFREKSAWITLACLFATFGAFFFCLGHGLIPERRYYPLHWFLMSVVAFVILQIALHVIAASLAIKDAKAPLDERERLIALKAGRLAHIALIIGVIAVPFSLHLVRLHVGEMGFLAMFGLWSSEVVRAVSKIVYYRMGR